MSEKVISIRSMQLGTENMVNKGILARVEINVHVPDGKVLYSVGNILVRKARDSDNLWIAMPSESFKVNTESGEEVRWKTIVKVGPDEGKQGGETPTPIQDQHMKYILDKYREALKAGKAEQTVQATTPVVAPTDPGEPAF